LRSRCGFWKWSWKTVTVFSLCIGSSAYAGALSPIQNPSTVRASGRSRDVSIEDYRNHLNQLVTLVQACAKARDLKNCDPLLVGPDDRVPLPGLAHGGRRLIRYGWLRVLFSKAEEPDQATPLSAPASKSGAAPAVQPVPPSTSALLVDAEHRLAFDLTQAVTYAAPDRNHANERSIMALVLAGRDFHDLQQPSLQDTMLEKVNNWLNRLLQNVTKWRAQSAWVGRVLVWGFIVAICAGLVWALLQLERRWRVRLVPQRRTPALTAPSARDWQLWLEDARRAASAGAWREAIHAVYWACIARLEARRLWPADRARTPREYLALVPVADPRHSGLSALTRSFERTWYGGRAAAETDYRSAEEIATSLIEGRSA